MRRRTLDRSGLRVSELCLGAMTFGTVGSGCDEKTASDLVAPQYNLLVRSIARYRVGSTRPGPARKALT